MSRRRIQVPRIEDGKMGRKVVVEIKCDRCARTEHLPANGAQASEEPTFKGTFQGVTVEYRDLCTSCKEIVTMRWHDLTKVLLKSSPQKDRTGKLAKITAAKTAPTPPPVPAKSSPHGTSPRS
jgi:hypothetical protein